MIVMERLPKRSRAHGSHLLELLIVIMITSVIVVILAPKETGKRMQVAAEMASVRELQIINTMQIQYKSQFQRYANTLAELGPQGADLIASTLASGDKDGYVFIMTATPGGYMIHANPKVFGRSGYRTFYTDQDGLIRQNWSPEPASASSPEFK
jgi:type II secretory pathway pseudopilin PulG